MLPSQGRMMSTLLNHQFHYMVNFVSGTSFFLSSFFLLSFFFLSSFFLLSFFFLSSFFLLSFFFPFFLLLHSSYLAIFLSPGARQQLDSNLEPQDDVASVLPLCCQYLIGTDENRTLITILKYHGLSSHTRMENV
jgi:hypothetical protein